MLSAGICTTVIRTGLRSWSSSQRTDSVNPWMACLAPQYPDCSGMPRRANVEPTCTMVPARRGTMRAKAARVPQT